MSLSSVQQQLAATCRAAPGVRSVTRGEQYRPNRQGGVTPLPEDCPTVRITQEQGVERGYTLAGTRLRQTPYVCGVWAYADDLSLGGESWPALREAIAAALRTARPSFRALPSVVDVRVMGERPTPRPLRTRGAAAQSLLHSEIVVQAWELV